MYVQAGHTCVQVGHTCVRSNNPSTAQGKFIISIHENEGKQFLQGYYNTYN